MRYAQFKRGQKLHLVYEPGDGCSDAVVQAGEMSWPLCGRRGGDHYRMSVNLPLGHACHNCLRVNRSRHHG